MNFYSYDMTTYAFNGEVGEAHESPEEPGVFMLPAWATFKAPKKLEGFTDYFDVELDDWVQKEITPEVVATEIVKELYNKDEQNLILTNLVNSNVKQMAVALGFVDAADAISFLGSKDQRGRDAASFQEWRNETLQALDNLKAGDFPTPDEFNSTFQKVKFKRNLILGVELPPDDLVDEAKRITALAATSEVGE